MDYSKIMPQDIVDMVWARLHDGKGQAIGKNFCLYLNHKGNKCAVGIFLPNHPAQKTVGDVFTILVKYRDTEADSDWFQFLDENSGLLNDLQVIHDHAANWWGGEFNGQDDIKKVCKRFKLKYPG
jgi:hypothetical protein